jgi:hypothetical protein
MATLFEMDPLGESGLKLNESQRRAVTHGKGPSLVMADIGPVAKFIRPEVTSPSNRNNRNINASLFQRTRRFELEL